MEVLGRVKQQQSSKSSNQAATPTNNSSPRVQEKHSASGLMLLASSMNKIAEDASLNLLNDSSVQSSNNNISNSKKKKSTLKETRDKPNASILSHNSTSTAGSSISRGNNNNVTNQLKKSEPKEMDFGDDDDEDDDEDEEDNSDNGDVDEDEDDNGDVDNVDGNGNAIGFNKGSNNIGNSSVNIRKMNRRVKRNPSFDDIDDDDDDEDGDDMHLGMHEKKKVRKLKKAVRWTEEESRRLRETVIAMMKELGPDRTGLWVKVSKYFPGKTSKHCRERWKCAEDPEISRAEWTMEEDLKIIRLHKEHGTKWSTISKELPGRPELSVKTRCISIERAKRRFWTAYEDAILVLLYQLLGQEWTTISKYLPGRKNNAIRSRLKSIQSYSHRLVPEPGDPAQTIPFPTVEILEDARHKAIEIVHRDFPHLQIPESLMAPLDPSTGLPFPLSKPRSYAGASRRRYQPADTKNSSPTSQGSTHLDVGENGDVGLDSFQFQSPDMNVSSADKARFSTHSVALPTAIASSTLLKPVSSRNLMDISSISKNSFEKKKSPWLDASDRTAYSAATVSSSAAATVAFPSANVSSTKPLQFSPNAFSPTLIEPSGKMANKRALLLENQAPVEVASNLPKVTFSSSTFPLTMTKSPRLESFQVDAKIDLSKVGNDKLTENDIQYFSDIPMNVSTSSPLPQPFHLGMSPIFGAINSGVGDGYESAGGSASGLLMPHQPYQAPPPSSALPSSYQFNEPLPPSSSSRYVGMSSPMKQFASFPTITNSNIDSLDQSASRSLRRMNNSSDVEFSFETGQNFVMKS